MNAFRRIVFDNDDTKRTFIIPFSAVTYIGIVETKTSKSLRVGSREKEMDIGGTTDEMKAEVLKQYGEYIAWLDQQ
jgi:hypothetical protein